MTELQLIKGRPKIFAIGSEEIMLSLIEKYVEDYNYEYVGSASQKDEIFEKIDNLSPHLIFLDTEIQGPPDFSVFSCHILLHKCSRPRNIWFR